jgi:hypothetical protein
MAPCWLDGGGKLMVGGRNEPLLDDIRNPRILFKDESSVSVLYFILLFSFTENASIVNCIAGSCIGYIRLPQSQKTMHIC